MHRINKTLVYFLLFTVASSALAFRIVVKAYDTLTNPAGLTYFEDEYGDIEQ
jgi:hypothetical protein